jgi:hypothetical protein
VAPQPITRAQLEAALLATLRKGVPPASAGELTRALLELGVDVERAAVKRALIKLTNEHRDVFAFPRAFKREGRIVHGTAYGTLDGALNETKEKGRRR